MTTILTKKLTMSNLRERKTGYMGKPLRCIGLESIFKSTSIIYDFLAKKYSDFFASTFSWDTYFILKTKIKLIWLEKYGHV